MLRNTSLVNFLDACALHASDPTARTAPVGLMVVGFGGEDERVLPRALRIETRWRIRGRTVE